MLVHRLAQPWVVEEEEDDDGEEDDQRWEEHKGKEEQAQPKGGMLTGEETTGHELELERREHGVELVLLSKSRRRNRKVVLGRMEAGVMRSDLPGDWRK